MFISLVAQDSILSKSQLCSIISRCEQSSCSIAWHELGHICPSLTVAIGVAEQECDAPSHLHALHPSSLLGWPVKCLHCTLDLLGILYTSIAAVGGCLSSSNTYAAGGRISVAHLGSLSSITRRPEHARSQQHQRPPEQCSSE